MQLSSSISLLFGMIKLQGSFAVQIGPPESRKPAEEQPADRQNDELRINCPKDLRESIVLFLQSQAARNHSFAAQQPTAAAASTVPPHQANPRPEPPPPPQRQQEGVEEQQEGEESNEQPQRLLPHQEATLDATACEAFASGAGGPVDVAEAAAAAEALGYDTADSAFGTESAGGGGGFESCCSEPLSELAASTATAAAPAASAVLSVPMSSLEALLPSTPPLGCSPPAKPAGGGCLGGGAGSGQEQRDAALAAQVPQVPPPPLRDPAFLAALGPIQEPPALDRSDYLSLMSYASSYNPSVAPLDSPRAEQATHGSSAEVYPQASAALPETELRPTALGSATDERRGGALPRKSPDSILGLRNLGLEGWTESSRRWESRYLEE